MKHLQWVLAALVVLWGVGSAQADTLYVDSSGMTTDGKMAYTSIQAAVNAASAGSKIIVDAGTYTENVTISTQGITLQGAQAGVSPVAGRSGPESILNGSIVVNPTAGFTLDGFTITANAHDAVASRATNSLIENNIISNPVYGIEVTVPAQTGTYVSSTILNNVITAGNASIYLVGSPNNTVENNAVSGGGTGLEGIDAYYSDNTTIGFNQVNGTSFSAIRLRGTHNSLVEYNQGTGNTGSLVLEQEGSSGNTYIHNFDGVSPTPEPSSIVLVLMGGCALCVGARKKWRR
jgi:parallel beta-helix repeat protein